MPVVGALKPEQRRLGFYLVALAFALQGFTLSAVLVHMVPLLTGIGLGAAAVTVWHVTRWQGEPANLATDEHDEVRWLTPADLSSLRLADPRIEELLDRVGGRASDPPP